ncbi:recombinase family protein [Bifidobacterium biavatii]|uniref:DNA invertase-like protein n=1 Tax=Bifidobacterium biavatii DSM 23969 TaxID=1437608 RepID=A0A086Z5W6_9BIFI|nr:recombinase family protein [Bifidobacterium biavatii]KFI41916.1 DNA invertase-like protein [Bifidobacterium biavatii DSM 23969]
MIIGYARVSTGEQDPALQEDALRAAGCERIYTDVGYSGAKAHRPQFDRMLDSLREGDIVVAWKLDRIFRSVKGLVDLMNTFQEKGVQFRSLTEGIDTTTPTGMLVFHIFASIAEFERDLIRERTNAGLKAARARGHHGGRPSVIDEHMLDMVEKLYFKAEMTASETAGQLGVSVSTVNRAARIVRERRSKGEGEQ